MVSLLDRRSTQFIVQPETYRYEHEQEVSLSNIVNTQSIVSLVPSSHFALLHIRRAQCIPYVCANIVSRPHTESRKKKFIKRRRKQFIRIKCANHRKKIQSSQNYDTLVVASSGGNRNERLQISKRAVSYFVSTLCARKSVLIS